MRSHRLGRIPTSAHICAEGANKWQPFQNITSPAVRGHSLPVPYAPPPPVAYKDGGIATLLEVLPGVFLQTFGIGVIYAGNVTGGLLLMFGYWLSLIVNTLLVFVLVGLITFPLTFLVFMGISIVMARDATARTNRYYYDSYCSA